MTMFKSGAGYEGFPHRETEGLAYLYGLSDFWSIIFQDSDLVDRFLESSSIGLAEVYSKFLQLTSTISVNDVQTFLHSEVKLLIIESTDKIDSISGTTYSIPEDVVGCKYIMDRPMLAINTLEENVHYFIDPVNSTITFHKPLEDLDMPSRTTAEGNLQVSMWMTDVTSDESLVYKYFGELIGVSPQNVTRVYRDFIRGLYFLYTQGPTVTLLERGLSLALGIPLSRTDEKVLLTVKNQTTGNWIVATDKSSYSIPYGLEPEVEPGDVLEAGKELVKVAEVKDYLVEDQWWLNLSIPKELIPTLPDESQRVAYPGNLTDSIMQDYLKHHTFLVRIKWDKTFNAANFDEVFRILYEAKPSYTYPIFVWSIIDTEEIDLNDDLFEGTIDYELVDSFGCSDVYINRNLEKLNERSEVCFIHGNYNPVNDDPADHVVVNYEVDKSKILNDPTNILEGIFSDGNIGNTLAIPSTSLTPLYNATRADIFNGFADVGILTYTNPPKFFIVANVPMNTNSYLSTVIRDGDNFTMGVTGVVRNEGQLDFPVSKDHNMYQAFVPPFASLESEENFLVMEIQSNLYSVFLIDAPVVVISCAYPLSGSEADVLAAGWDARLNLSADSQTVSYDIQSQLAGLYDWLALPPDALTAPPTITMNTPGKKAIEMQPISMPKPTTGTITMEVAILPPDQSASFSLRVGWGGLAYTISALNNFGDVIIASGLQELPTDLAIVYDGDTNEVYVRYNGANYATTSAALTEVIMVCSATEYQNVDAAFAGQTVQWRAETNAQNFIGSYEAGTTDICGNVI